MIELNLVKLITPLGSKYYHAVSDRGYDAMLAGNLDEKEFGTWEWVGSVYIEEKNLNDLGYFIKE